MEKFKSEKCGISISQNLTVVDGYWNVGNSSLAVLDMDSLLIPSVDGVEVENIDFFFQGQLSNRSCKIYNGNIIDFGTTTNPKMILTKTEDNGLIYYEPLSSYSYVLLEGITENIETISSNVLYLNNDVLALSTPGEMIIGSDAIILRGTATPK